ncbi:MAG: hypothetical protein H0U40_12080 [Chloroflexia bacterium]|nr:hypothetical protein [Chloroflexia bacterium]
MDSLAPARTSPAAMSLPDSIDVLDGPELLAWRGRGIVIFAFPEPRPGGWVVTRGWHHGDRLTDIRRWTFPTRLAASRQMHRLVRDATAPVPLARS